MLKKLNYVLDRRQKVHLIILLFIIFVGAFVELLGVSAILPVVNIALTPEVIDEKWYLVLIRDKIGLVSANQIIIFLAAIIIIIYIFKNLYITFMYSQQYRFIFENQRKLATKLLECYMHQKYQFHVSKNVAELQRNVTADVNGFYTVVLYVLQFLAEISVCVVLVVYLAVEDLMTTIVVAALVIAFILFFFGFFKRVLVKKGEENRWYTVVVSKWVLQAFSGIKEIKVTNAENFFVKNYNENYKKCTTIQRQQSMLTFMPRPIMETVCICGLLLAVIIKMAGDNSDITSFIPTLTVFAVAAFRMLPSFNRITGYMGGIMFNKPSIDAIYKDLKEIEILLKEQEQEEQDSIEIKVENSIQVENVSFRYPENDRWILEHANLTIQKNTSVAFIGSSGAGKTTLADLILGLFEPIEGRVTVDGMDIQDHMKSWHECIGYIPQNIYLMDDTIKANITFGIAQETIDEDKLKLAIKEAQLEDLIDSLPEGIDTVIGDRGVKLSGGQRQRIGIARALYRNPKVLVLDEATSALDNETEKEVMEAIDGLHGTRTLIVIAHRLSTIRNCDKIYEVGKGKIDERDKKQIFGA